MMLRNLLLFCGALLISQSAFARPGTEAPVHPNYDDHFTVVGLCTANQNNNKNHYFTSGHCKTIWETLTKQGGDPENCVAKMVEQVRLRALDDDESKAKLQKQGLKNPEKLNLGFQCDGQNNAAEENMDKILKDPTKFSTVLMQLFANIAIQESKWQVNYKGNAGQDRGVKCETDCGIFGLNKADMEKPEYKCGCEIPNKTDDQKQSDPTMDGHLNLRCGITMALVEVLKDKENNNLLGGGKPKGKDQPKDERYGMAKIFKSLQSVEDKTPEVDTKREKVIAKMKTYCELEAHNQRGNKELQEKLNESKQANPILPGARDATTTQ